MHGSKVQKNEEYIDVRRVDVESYLRRIYQK